MRGGGEKLAKTGRVTTCSTRSRYDYLSPNLTRHRSYAKPIDVMRASVYLGRLGLGKARTHPSSQGFILARAPPLSHVRQTRKAEAGSRPMSPSRSLPDVTDEEEQEGGEQEERKGYQDGRGSLHYSADAAPRSFGRSVVVCWQ